MTTCAGEDRDPVFATDGRAFHYLSEASGTLDVHRMGVDGGAPRQRTRFAGVPGLDVKDANTGQYLESRPTEPDIRVRNEPRAVGGGRRAAGGGSRLPRPRAGPRRRRQPG